MKKFYLIGICSFLLIACEKDELPIKAFDRGEVIVNSVDMNQDYRYQVYFKLNTNQIVKSNLKTIWDISFDCSANNLIFLNSAKSMFIWNTGKKDFDLVKDTIGFENGKIWDRSSGNVDSTAFGNIGLGLGDVYIIDRGYNEKGSHLGFKKIKLISITNGTYRFQYSNLNGEGLHSIEVEKNNAFNSIGYSFETNTIIEKEPQKNEFDLIFTQYTYTYIDPYQPYLVTGVLLNSNKYRIAIDRDKKFQEISITDTLLYNFSNELDKIGFNWKYFNFNSGIYSVNPDINYILQDKEGYFYKLHFVDFYNEEGKKGCPKFEFQKL